MTRDDDGPATRTGEPTSTRETTPGEPVARPGSETDVEGDSGGRRRRGQDFPLAGLGRRGYDVTEVETFVHQAERALRSDPPAMAPYEVQDARFRGVRWRRGYDMRSVDARMEQLHTALRERHGQDGVGGIQGHESERPHRIAFWIYAVAGVLVVVIVGFALSQL